MQFFIQVCSEFRGLLVIVFQIWGYFLFLNFYYVLILQKFFLKVLNEIKDIFFCFLNLKQYFVVYCRIEMMNVFKLFGIEQMNNVKIILRSFKVKEVFFLKEKRNFKKNR